MQYPGQVNKIAAGSVVIIMNFEPKMGCGLHKTRRGLIPSGCALINVYQKFISTILYPRLKYLVSWLADL